MTSLLFKNNQIVFDNGQIVFTDNPNTCTCCGEAYDWCICGDGDPPRIVGSVSLAVSLLPATYTEDRYHRIQYDPTTYSEETLALEINGLDALNGTYMGGLEAGPACATDDPDPCALLDSRRFCKYLVEVPGVPLTGTYTRTFFSNVINPAGVTVNQSWNIYGFASLGYGQTVLGSAVEVGLGMCIWADGYSNAYPTVDCPNGRMYLYQVPVGGGGNRNVYRYGDCRLDISNNYTPPGIISALQNNASPLNASCGSVQTYRNRDVPWQYCSFETPDNCGMSLAVCNNGYSYTTATATHSGTFNYSELLYSAIWNISV